MSFEHLTPRVRKAKLIAMAYHDGQMYGKHPYMNHIGDVYMTARTLGITDEDTLIACLLHDTLEDTTYTHGQLQADFGIDVMQLVDLVTDPKIGSRKEKKAAFYESIKADPYDPPEYNQLRLKAITVKLCDRYANTLSGEKNDMYRKEHAEFRKNLLTDDPIHVKLFEMIDKNLSWNETEVQK
jgi:(p)ppGpp synthase/HD superfamily hydrolase